MNRNAPNFLLLNGFFFGTKTSFDNLQWNVIDRCVFSKIGCGPHLKVDIPKHAHAYANS